MGKPAMGMGAITDENDAQMRSGVKNTLPMGGIATLLKDGVVVVLISPP